MPDVIYRSSMRCFLLRIGLLPTNFLDLDIFEMLYDLYAISKYIKLWFER